MKATKILGLMRQVNHCNLLFAVCHQRPHSRKTSAVGRDGYRVHEWWPSYGGRLVCQSQCERWIWQVSRSVTNPVNNWINLQNFHLTVLKFWFCWILCLFHSIFKNVAALKVAGDCRPAGGALRLSGADGQRVGQSEAARHCDEHSVQKGLHRWRHYTHSMG